MSNASDFVIKDGVLTKYWGFDRDIVIPKGVTKIESMFFEGVFEKCTRLESVVIPEGVEVIGNRTFWGCTGLKEIILPSTLKRIGGQAFENCEALKELLIPDGVEKVAYSFIDHCTGLTKIKWPDSVMQEVDGGRVSLRGCNGLQDKEGFIRTKDTIWGYCGSAKELIIPEGIATIAEEAFRKNKTLIKVVFPESVTRILNKAFEGCRKLTSAQFPESAVLIADGAFENSALTQMIIPKLWEWSAVIGENKKREKIIPLACPSIKINGVNNKAYKICLAMGYLQNKGLYSTKIAGTYEKYCEENMALILEAAERNNISLGECTKGDNSSASVENHTAAKLSLKEAREKFAFEMKDYGYKITDYHGEDTVVEIPYTIGTTDVMGVDPYAFKWNTILKCSGKLFARLSHKYQLNAILAYLSGDVAFATDQKQAIEHCIKTKVMRYYEYAVENQDTQLFQKLYEYMPRQFTLPEINALLEKGNDQLEMMAFLLQLKHSWYTVDEMLDFEQKEAEHALSMDSWTPDDWQKYFHFIMYKTKYKGSYVIAKGRLKKSNVVIPDSIEGIPVVAIEYGAYADNRDVVEIVISSSMQNIEEGAFRNCRKLEKITFLSKDTKLGDKAITNCPKLTIHAPVGSYAEQYAKENHIPFVAE